MDLRFLCSRPWSKTVAQSLYPLSENVMKCLYHTNMCATGKVLVCDRKGKKYASESGFLIAAQYLCYMFSVFFPLFSILFFLFSFIFSIFFFYFIFLFSNFFSLQVSSFRFFVYIYL